MKIKKGTYQLIIFGLVPSLATMPFDSCHNRVIRGEAFIWIFGFALKSVVGGVTKLSEAV